MKERYEPRRAMEPVWPWPRWIVYAPWFVVAILLLTMVLQGVRHEPISWTLLTPLVMHVCLGFWLPFQRRIAELMDDR